MSAKMQPQFLQPLSQETTFFAEFTYQTGHDFAQVMQPEYFFPAHPRIKVLDIIDCWCQVPSERDDEDNRTPIFFRSAIRNINEEEGTVDLELLYSTVDEQPEEPAKEEIPKPAKSKAPTKKK